MLPAEATSWQDQDELQLGHINLGTVQWIISGDLDSWPPPVWSHPSISRCDWQVTRKACPVRLLSVHQGSSSTVMPILQSGPQYFRVKWHFWRYQAGSGFYVCCPDKAEHASYTYGHQFFHPYTLMVKLQRKSDLVCDLLLSVLCTAMMMLDDSLAVFWLIAINKPSVQASQNL